MSIKKGAVALIEGLEYDVLDVLKQDHINATYDIRIAIKEHKINGRKELEKALLSGIEPEEAIVEWFYTMKIKEFKTYDAIKNRNVKNAVDEIRKLMLIDELSMVEIVDVLNFSLYDKFWKNKILSLCGLRKKNPSGVKKIDSLRLAAKGAKEEKFQESKKPLTKQKNRKMQELD